MSEQQMADYKLIVVADSGYESTTDGRCTAEQYGQAMAALHGTFPAAQQPRRWQPLTDEQIDRLWGDAPTVPQKGKRREIARAAINEFCRINGLTLAHGITGEQP